MLSTPEATVARALKLELAKEIAENTSTVATPDSAEATHLLESVAGDFRSVGRPGCHELPREAQAGFQASLSMRTMVYTGVDESKL